MDPTQQPNLAVANVGSITRAIIIAGGGYVVANGWLTKDQVAQLAGAAAIAAPIVWALYKNLRTHRALKAAIAAPAGSAGNP